MAGGLLGACTPSPVAGPETATFTVAEADLHPQGIPAEHRTVSLRHRWDADFPGRPGQATYALQLPPTSPARPMALLLERVGNQATIRVNGLTVLQLGAPGDDGFDAGKASQLVVLPSGLLHAVSRNELVIQVTAQPMRLGGLGPVRFGTLEAIAPVHARLQLMDQTLSAAYAASLLLMGGLAAGLWWRQRDPLYGTFSLAALLGVFRHVDRVWIGQPLPWPLEGATLALCYGVHLALILHFSLRILHEDAHWLSRLIHAVTVTVGVLAVVAFAWVVPALWTLALVLLALLGIACLGVVARRAVRGGGPIAWLVAGTLALLVTAGLHDLLILRLGLLGGSSVGLTPHAMMGLVVLLAGLIVARYSRSVSDYRALNEHLADRVATREAQLREAFDTLRAQEQHRAVADERQRIMREIHDGIGSQLVGVLNMLGPVTLDRAALEREIRLALDEMRMAVDSLQPMDRDLGMVLATLRYRLQPRLEAAHLQVVWDVERLPPIADLAPPAIFELQRILLEAFTNVLRHAHATRVVVQAQWRDQPPTGVVLRVTDDGVGPGPPRPAERVHGKGLPNMRARAAAIGATLRIEPAGGGGTSVIIDWPLSLQPDAGVPQGARGDALAAPEAVDAVDAVDAVSASNALPPLE